METRKVQPAGRFLREADRMEMARQTRSRHLRRRRRWVSVTLLLLWDGMLLYLILRCWIVPVWGGVFVAVVSVYLGYQMK